MFLKSILFYTEKFTKTFFEIIKLFFFLILRRSISEIWLFWYVNYWLQNRLFNNQLYNVKLLWNAVGIRRLISIFLFTYRFRKTIFSVTFPSPERCIINIVHSSNLTVNVFARTRHCVYYIAVLYELVYCPGGENRIVFVSEQNGIFNGFTRRKKRLGKMEGWGNGTRNRNSWRDCIYRTGSHVRSESAAFGARETKKAKTDDKYKSRSRYVCA